LGSGERPKAPETDAAAGRAGDAMPGGRCSDRWCGFARVSFLPGGRVVVAAEGNRTGREATRRRSGQRRWRGWGGVETKIKEE
jgi:hypothetical protein